MNLRKIVGFSIGPVGSATIGIVTLPMMSWLFKPEDIGRMNIIGIVVSFSLMLLMLGLDQAYVREFHVVKDKHQLFKACITPGLIVFIIIASISIVFSSQLSGWLFEEINPIYWIITLTCIIANFFTRFLGLILRMQERGLAFSISQIAPKLLQLIFIGCIILLNLKRDFLTMLWMIMASSLIVTIVYAWNTRKHWISAIKKKIIGTQIKSLLKFGTPLIFSGLAYWGLSATSIIILRANSSLGELGIYSVTNSFASAAAIFQSIFTIVWAPTVYKWVEQGVDMKRIDDIARQALAIICIIFTLVGLLSWATDFILPSHYTSVKYLVVCAITPSLLYTLSEITCVGIGITRRTTLTIWVTMMALVTNVFLSLYLVPSHGAAGAVIANSLAYTIFFIARTEASARVWRKFPRKNLYIFVSLPVGLSCISIIFGSELPFHFSLIWLFWLPIFVWNFKPEFIYILRFPKKTNRINEKQHF